MINSNDARFGRALGGIEVLGENLDWYKHKMRRARILGSGLFTAAAAVGSGTGYLMYRAIESGHASDGSTGAFCAIGVTAFLGLAAVGTDKLSDVQIYKPFKKDTETIIAALQSEPEI